MPASGWLLIAAAVVACIVAVVLTPRAIREEKLKRLSGRQPLTPGDLYARYYASSGIPCGTVAETVRRAGEALGLPPELLRPDDRFDEELGPALARSLDGSLFDLSEEFSAALRFHHRQTGQDVETLDDLIRAVAACERAMGKERRQ